jgi:hypothetical protein
VVRCLRLDIGAREAIELIIAEHGMQRGVSILQGLNQTQAVGVGVYFDAPRSADTFVVDDGIAKTRIAKQDGVLEIALKFVQPVHHQSPITNHESRPHPHAARAARIGCAIRLTSSSSASSSGSGGM